MNQALELLAKFGPQRIAAMGAVTLALIGFFAFVILRMSQPAMGVLYSDLSMQDAGSIIRDLEAKGVTYETRADGQTIMAPRDQLAKLRMDFAGKGLPTGGGIGYEIFDKGDAFSSTSFVQNINHLRALEGELARTIRSISRVEAARVHLVLPERRLFERDKEQPRASIVLKLRGDLDGGQVRAIRHLAASAVEGLKPERISIVDERGRLLADGAQMERAAAGGGGDQQIETERRVQRQIEDIVAGVVGSGRARVQVAAELDYNRIESRSETFDPESRVVRSTQTRNESQVSANGENGVSVGNELPGANGNQGGAGPRDQQAKNEEIINYEISRTTKVETVEAGRVKRLSVAVLVDGNYATGSDGQQAYQPRTPEELDRIATLVRTAIGFDRNRGDQVEVVNLRFAEPPKVEPIAEPSLISSLISPTKEDVMRYLELGVVSLLTLIVLMTVVRPMVKGIIAPGAPILLRGGSGDVMGAELAGASAAPSPPLPDSAAVKMIEVARINGQVQQESLKQVGELAKVNPNETVAVIRQWIHER